ncbi:HNH endonuclease signature motif containing protein [Aeromicrobium terrae]|uniref:DUF222 domain-containing protein n=1 Tax=Aeromicrobium terrae TaxID=2498846 RepID=A0A5C8NLF3_9ACTN|nr:HNH endonuclease signature motif containing protein [Aeromicrobium terrae]TXL62102.1 DUF222 domain-containing protein [Aeromicrobium terrae]
MTRSEHVSADRLTDLARARAAAEATEWSGMLQYADQAEAAIQASQWSPMVKQMNVAAIALEIGTAMGLSEGQVHRRLSVARRVRDSAPLTWLAFRDGRVDAVRLMIISDGIDKLKRDASIVRLDQRVVTYAETHTTAQLRQWVRRFIARVEPDEHEKRAEDERKTRRVDALHGEDGMGFLDAKLPSYLLAAIDKRLIKEAKALGADDPRTLQQRRADLLAAWLTTNKAGEPAIHADIAVTIPAASLAGVNDDPIVSADGDWVIPAAWISDLVANGNTLWHRIITDGAGHTLDHTYLGRFAPETVKKAIAYRDATCQAPGCTRPADQCDTDHRIPHPTGPTSGTNLWALCRRHHQQKGHQVIRWLLPSGREAPAETAAHSPPIEDLSWMEHQLADFLVDPS